MAAQQPSPDEDLDLLPEEDALEEIAQDDDAEMDSDGDDGGADDEALTLQNDSVAFFDKHGDSVFAIAQHPIHAHIVATGGSEGEADDAPGMGYVLDVSAAQRPVLPASYAADGGAARGTLGLQAVTALEGHTDSVSALAFTLPKGEILVSGGMDGRLRAYAVGVSGANIKVQFLAEAQEVPEINWIAPCPSTTSPNTIALGASDGSVWVYSIDPSDRANPLQIIQSYFLHQGSCTAGAWTPDGNLLATVAEDGSLYVWDVWGLAAAANLVAENGTAVSLTAADGRFTIEGGLFSLAIEPKGAFLATGGAGGEIKIVSLPQLSRARAGGRAGGKSNDPSAGGQILADLKRQTDSVESLSFITPANAPSTTLLAAGSSEGSIVVFDATRRFAVRRTIPGAHNGVSVVSLAFVKGTWLLTSCGMDGVVRRWDLRSSDAVPGAGASNLGMVGEWRGHAGEEAGGGVMGFVQGDNGERIITAGDDGVVLVFDA